MWTVIEHPAIEAKAPIHHADGSITIESTTTKPYWTVEDPRTGDYICYTTNSAKKFQYDKECAIAKADELNKRDYPDQEVKE